MSRPDPKRNDALETAFEAHYESQWIEELSHADACGLLLEMWNEYRTSNDDSLVEKHQSVVNILMRTAEKHCEHYAETNVEIYLESEEEF